jgi:hypothetical protein
LSNDEENVGTEESSEDLDENADVLDDEEKDLLEKLLQRVESAGVLDEELSTDINSFNERVEGVIDSVERIENIERTKLEKEIFIRDGDEETTETEESGRQEVEKKEGMEDIAGDQIYLPSESPYEEVSEGGFHPDEEADLISYYGSEAADILTNMQRLIQIKLDKNDKEEAMRLFELANAIGGNSEEFERSFSSIMEGLGISKPELEDQDKTDIETKETKVLDPELAEGIDILEKRSKTAIDQLNVMIESSELSQEDFNKVKDQYLEATELFREKRFHKSHQIAIEGLETIRNQVQDDLDNKIQDNLYKSREMVEKLEKDDKLDDLNKLDELKKDIDNAEKAYLTNEYEKANLLSKRVMTKILDITEPDGIETKERLKDLRQKIERLREKNILHDEIGELGTILRSAEKLFRRRDIANARKLVQEIDSKIDVVQKKADTYVEAKEMEIRLNNRIKRLTSSGHDLVDMSKKLKFMTDYLKEGRFEDVSVVGKDLEDELNSVEHVKEEKEAKRIFEELESLMTHSAELEDHDVLKAKFKDIQDLYIKGDLKNVRENGEPLLLELKNRTKTLNVERVRRIANGIIESKMLLMKMRTLNLDSTEYERRMRKIKSLLKEGSRTEGLKQLDRNIHDMKKDVREYLDRMKRLTMIYRDSLEVVMDRHREQSVIFHIRNRHLPIIRKMEELGRYKAAIDNYRKMGDKFSGLKLPEDRRSMIETELTECKFEIYKRKEQGLDISEPLSLYTNAQKMFNSGDIVPAEFLIEISKRYCQEIIPLET